MKTNTPRLASSFKVMHLFCCICIMRVWMVGCMVVCLLHLLYILLWKKVKYLGLLGLHKIMKKRPREVSQHREMILQCLGDDDVTIRMRALDLISAMVQKKLLFFVCVCVLVLF